MKTSDFQYLVKMFDGSRLVGVARARTEQHAATILQDWNAGGERHQGRIDREAILEGDAYMEPIPGDSYLTQ